ncbi:hypothetical protein AX16_000621 [Volvariella volvacea WC 439]|nr:hypothetical protein AX16_000621 [Volvariella volvacea WC 439]
MVVGPTVSASISPSPGTAVVPPSQFERLLSPSSMPSSLSSVELSRGMSPAHRVIVLTGHALEGQTQAQVAADANGLSVHESRNAILPSDPSSATISQPNTPNPSARQRDSLHPASSSPTPSPLVVVVRDALPPPIVAEPTTLSPALITENERVPRADANEALSPTSVQSRPAVRQVEVLVSPELGGSVARRSREFDPNDPNTVHGRVVAAREAAGNAEARRDDNATTDTRPATPTNPIPSASSTSLGNEDPLTRFLRSNGHAAAFLNEYHRIRLAHHRPTDPVISRVQDASREALLARRSLDNVIAALSVGLTSPVSESNPQSLPSSAPLPPASSQSTSPSGATVTSPPNVGSPILHPVSPHFPSPFPLSALSSPSMSNWLPASRENSSSSAPSSLSLSLENFASRSSASRTGSSGSVLSRLPSMASIENFPPTRSSNSLTSASLTLMNQSSSWSGLHPTAGSWVDATIHAEPEPLLELPETETGSVDSASVNANDGSVDEDSSNTAVTRVPMPVREGSTYRVIRHIGPDGQEVVTPVRVGNEAVEEGSQDQETLNPSSRDQSAPTPTNPTVPITSLPSNPDIIPSSISPLPPQSPIPTPAAPRFTNVPLVLTPSVAAIPSLAPLNAPDNYGTGAVGLVFPDMPAYDRLTALSEAWGIRGQATPVPTSPPPPSPPTSHPVERELSLSPSLFLYLLLKRAYMLTLVSSSIVAQVDANGDPIVPQPLSQSSQESVSPPPLPVTNSITSDPSNPYIRSPSLEDDLRFALEAGRAFQIPPSTSTARATDRNDDADGPTGSGIRTGSTGVWSVGEPSTATSSPLTEATIVDPDGTRSPLDETGAGAGKIRNVSQHGGSAARTRSGMGGSTFVPYPLPMPLSGMVSLPQSSKKKRRVGRVGEGAGFAGR